MKYIEDGRSLVERNHDAREYCYQCRREREARMNRIVRRCLVVSSMIFMCSLLDGRSLVERNHDAREYCYQCRREREARMNRIVRRCLVVSSMIFMCSLLAGFMF